MYVELFIIVAKTAILLLGGSITLYAYRAYRRTDDPSLRALALGFGIVTFGAIVAGVLDQLLGVGIAQGVAVDSALTALGFAVILYSLYVE